MNLYPYNAGHVMIAPRRHVGSLAEATPEELSETMALARRLESVMAEVYTPDGINMGLNLGKAAGAGVADHIHMHMVPRWVGDTNFMTTVGGTRVIPEDPVEACAKLKAQLSRNEAARRGRRATVRRRRPARPCPRPGRRRRRPGRHQPHPLRGDARAASGARPTGAGSGSASSAVRKA